MSDRKPNFPSYEGASVSYGGRSYPSIGIEEGDNIDYVIEKVIEGSLQSPEVTEHTESVDISALQGITSPCAKNIKDNLFEYEVDISDTKVDFSYNFLDTEGEGMNVLRTEVEIIGSNGSQSTLKGWVGGASLPATLFPLNVLFKIDIIGECGLVKLRHETVVDLSNEKYRTSFNIQDFGDPKVDSPKGTKEAVEILADALKQLDSKLNTQIEQLKEEVRKLRTSN